MAMNILLPFLLLPFSSISANRYYASCTGDSDCDQYQKCFDHLCLCNKNERRFWTGEICAVCVDGFTLTNDRCYQSVSQLKTWSEARKYCRDRYADLFTWRNNKDEQFIRPIVQNWALTDIVPANLNSANRLMENRLYIAWAGAQITSLNPHTTQWVDSDGMQLTSSSSEWCDPTVHAGYTLPKEPTSAVRKTSNGTEREDCVTYNFGPSGTNLLCLADDYCSQKYSFICEMNAASMKLANSVLHGSDGDDIDFEQQVPTQPPSYPDAESGTDDGNIPSALSASSSNSSMTLYLLIGVTVLLIIGAIVGYMVIKKKKQAGTTQIKKGDAASEGRASFTSSVGSMIE